MFRQDFFVIMPDFYLLYVCYILFIPALEEHTFSQVKQVLVRHYTLGAFAGMVRCNRDRGASKKGKF